jgi:dTDP-4-dehydrorhamnose reductase
MSKVLITGGSGLLGRACVAAFQAADYTVVAPTHAACDLTDATATEALLQEVQPDLILNCAAQRRPDLCEANTPAVRALNVTLPERLARVGVPLIHISTDYVFNGTQAPYEVDAPRRPLNQYGRQKAEAEAAIELFEHVAILRLPILYGPTPALSASAVTCLAANLMAAKGAPVKMDNLAVRYPTLTTDIARQLLALAPHVGHALHGIFHYSGQEPMTKHLMALHMARCLGIDPALCLSDTTPPTVPRPYDCHLSVKRLQQLALFVEPTPFAAALPAILGQSAS